MTRRGLIRDRTRTTKTKQRHRGLPRRTSPSTSHVLFSRLSRLITFVTLERRSRSYEVKMEVNLDGYDMTRAHVIRVVGMHAGSHQQPALAMGAEQQQTLKTNLFPWDFFSLCFLRETFVGIGNVDAYPCSASEIIKRRKWSWKGGKAAKKREKYLPAMSQSADGSTAWNAVKKTRWKLTSFSTF